MLDRNNTLPKKSLRQFILNDNSPADPGITAEAMKRGFFGAIFYNTVNAFKAFALKSLVITATFFSLIELTQDYFYSVREKNRNNSFWFKHILGTLLFVAEVLAITFFVSGTIVSALIAPAIFTGITGTKFLVSFARALYYGAKVLFADQDEIYTQNHAHNKNHFKENLKNTFISAILFGGVFAGFLAPEIPAIAIAASLALTLKWATCITLSAFGLSTLAVKLSIWLKNKFGGSSSQNLSYQPLVSQERMISNRLDLSNHVKNKYLHNRKLDHLIPSHIDDLLIKLEVLHEKNQTDRTYLMSLINEERLRVTLDSDKWQTLILFEKLMNGDNLNLRYENMTYDNTAYGLARYLDDKGLLKSVLHSAFEINGGMQKIFVLVDHYCKLNPEVLYKNAVELDEKQFFNDKTQCYKELVRELKTEINNKEQSILLKEKENKELRDKFTKIKFECEYKSNSPKLEQKPTFYRSKSMPTLNVHLSLKKLRQ